MPPFVTRRLPAALVVAAVPLLASVARASDLALERVMLSSAGVGYFEYRAAADGATSLGLDVPLAAVDDVLKSIVVFDSAGGVGGLELPGRDQTHSAFGDVPFGPEALDSPLAFLNSLQGIELTVRGPRPMTGRLLRAEAVRESADPAHAADAPSISRTRVTLMTVEGLQQFVLEETDAVQVADPALRERISRALAALRHESSQDARHITIRSAGTGKREIRVGYVAGAPLWKASYRLVLPDPGADPATAKARMQGWATLENDSGTDWSGVSLTLQYGNPVTFRQAIYRSYFVERPDVPVEVLGHILPDVDTRATDEPQEAAKAADGLQQQLRGLRPGVMARGAMVGAMAGSAPMPAMAPAATMAAPSEAVAAAEGTEETVFPLPNPVTLAAGHSASVPILDREVPADRIALAQVNQPHPLAAIRVKNDAGVSFPAGVLTLYDATGAAPYAGDARLGGLPSGESRLISFAQDLRTTLEWHRSGATTIAGLTAAGGVLRVDERDRQITRVVITAPATEPRHVLVEIPKGADQVIPTDGLKPSEETATAWRFSVTLKAAEQQTVTITLDRIRRQAFGILQDPATIVRVLNEQGLSDAARAALSHIGDLRQAEAKAAADRDQIKTQIDAVDADEARVRENLKAVTASDAIRTRLLRQLDDGETRIAELGRALDHANQAVDAAHRALADAVGSLKI